MTDGDLILIVPCYNEAGRLPGDRFLEFVRARAGVRLLFVDDGSSDGTAAVHAELVKAAPGRIEAMRLPRNQGKAEAVRLGMLKALDSSPSLVGFWDADLATPLDAVDDFLAVAAARPSVEIILGARVLLMGRDIRRKAARHYLGRVFATAASVTLRIPVYDTQCGAKVFRVTPNVRTILAEPFRSRWIFDVELLARYLDLRGDDDAPQASKIYELAVHAWHDVPGSKVRATDFVRSLFQLLAIARRREGRRSTGAGTGRA